MAIRRRYVQWTSDGSGIWQGAVLKEPASTATVQVFEISESKHLKTAVYLTRYGNNGQDQIGVELIKGGVTEAKEYANNLARRAGRPPLPIKVLKSYHVNFMGQIYRLSHDRYQAMLKAMQAGEFVELSDYGQLVVRSFENFEDLKAEYNPKSAYYRGGGPLLATD